MGLWFEGLPLSSFLKVGITRTIFQVDGNVPFCHEKLKIIVKGIQMVLEVLFSIWWVMPSSPQALPIFNACKISLTSCSVICILDNNASVLGGTSGETWLVSSTNEIEQHYLFNRFALILSSCICISIHLNHYHTKAKYNNVGTFFSLFSNQWPIRFRIISLEWVYQFICT